MCQRESINKYQADLDIGCSLTKAHSNMKAWAEKDIGLLLLMNSVITATVFS